MNTLRIQAEKDKDTLINWRRKLHQHPEIGLEEFETSKFVQEQLKGLGLEDVQVIAKTGVVGLLKGEEPGPTVALRADMDALPIQDEKTVEYASKREGKAHLCGHDGHTTMLLGAVKILLATPPKRGNVKFIFQPGEEGYFGAEKMIENGALENPKVDAIAGLHVNPMVPTGHVTCSPKEVCAAADFFDLEIKGQGGHAAHPHLSTDSITIATEVISSLQQIVSRQLDPITSTVLTIGQIHGGTVNNAIASSVKIGGTVRTLDPDIRKTMKDRMEKIIKGITEGFGATYQFDYHYFYPQLINTASLIPTLKKSVEDVLGLEGYSVAKPSMGGEDFSFYIQKIPGVFFRLGVRNEDKNAVYPLHHPKFDLDEDALPYGASCLAQYALNYLNDSTL
ncbi:M20 family metallopeptidase [Aquibacillus sp. 3ASR75-11]|uniref:M20 family metallopeptidase n=1 Tax=Terrihalobacillus insolitus TaxID=2950438 RepID=A0A9X4AKR9_9BACI|nr:M20 family metallopeptidase [Terrihalobacillus insolitus]MDC3423401.1 M20 family metallopeptidase [Terrihalobacillus insolitus]